MNNQFDELTKGLAQSITRRGAIKQVGVGLASMALAYFGLAMNARAAKRCATNTDCGAGQVCYNGVCAPVGCVSAGGPCERSTDCCSGHCGRIRLPWSNGYYRGCIG